MAHFTQKKKLNTFQWYAQNGWNILGAGGGGSLFVPAVSPHDPKTMMIGCDMTATYITYDSGAAWNMLNIDGRVDAIAFDQNRKGVIYAGSAGLYRSIDNGSTWERIFPTASTILSARYIEDEALRIYKTKDDFFEGGRIQQILINPNDSNHICVGTGTGLDIGWDSDALFLFESLDNGETWKKIGQIEGRRFQLLSFGGIVKQRPGMQLPTAVTSEDLQKLYFFTDAAFYVYDSDNEMLIKKELPNHAETAAIIRSHEGDALYRNPFMFNLYQVKAGAAGIQSDTGVSVFYIVSEMRFDANGKMQSGVYRSEDLGQTWIELPGLDIDFLGPENGQCRLFRAIAVSANTPDTIYVSVQRHPEIFECPMPEMNVQGIVRSEDGGNTWEWVLKMDDKLPDNLGIGWFEHSYDTDWLGAPFYFGVSPSNPAVCLAACQGFAWVTMDGGKTWDQVYCDMYEDGTYYGKNLECTTCYYIRFDPFHKENMVITYADNGMLKSTNGGKTWKHCITGVPRQCINTCYDIVFDPEVDGRAWGVWTSVHDLPRETIFRKTPATLRKMARGVVCVTEDCAENWTSTSKGLPEMCVPSSIVLDPVSPKENRTLYISCYINGVYKSIDHGKTWQIKNNGIGENRHAYQIKRAADGTLYLVVIKGRRCSYTMEETDHAYDFLDGALYRSVDGAENWEQIVLSQGVIFPHKVEIDPSNLNRIYVTAWPVSFADCEKYGGVYRSEDGGKTWENVFDEQVRVYGVEVDPKHPNCVYIVTFEHDAFRSEDYGSTWKRIDGYNFKWGHNPIMDPYDDNMIYISTYGGSVFHGRKV